MFRQLENQQDFPRLLDISLQTSYTETIQNAQFIPKKTLRMTELYKRGLISTGKSLFRTKRKTYSLITLKKSIQGCN